MFITVYHGIVLCIYDIMVITIITRRKKKQKKKKKFSVIYMEEFQKVQ